MEIERADAFAGAVEVFEKFSDAFELELKRAVIGRADRDGLAEAAACFDEDEFAAERRWEV